MRSRSWDILQDHYEFVSGAGDEGTQTREMKGAPPPAFNVIIRTSDMEQRGYTFVASKLDCIWCQERITSDITVTIFTFRATDDITACFHRLYHTVYDEPTDFDVQKLKEGTFKYEGNWTQCSPSSFSHTNNVSFHNIFFPLDKAAVVSCAVVIDLVSTVYPQRGENRPAGSRASYSHGEQQHHRNPFPSICVEASIKLPVGHSSKVKIICWLQQVQLGWTAGIIFQ